MKLRFKKVQHNLILKERKIKTRKKGEELIEEHGEFHDEKTQQFRYFDDISGYSGVNIIRLLLWLLNFSHVKLRLEAGAYTDLVFCTKKVFLD